jgi:hypothetical protein
MHGRNIRGGHICASSRITTLAPTGRHGQGKKSRRMVGRLQAPAEHDRGGDHFGTRNKGR